MDVLHDGPVPEGLRLEELSNIRAKFIAECDWDSLQNAKDSFRKRDIVSHELSQIRRSGTLEQL